MSGEGYMKAAYAYLYIRDFERAAASFARAIACDPNNPSYYFRASVTAHRSGLYQMAHEFAKQAAELDPDNPMYVGHLDIVEAALSVAKGQAAYIEGDKSLAKAAFEAALERDPLNVDAARALASYTDSEDAQETTGTPEAGAIDAPKTS